MKTNGNDLANVQRKLKPLSKNGWGQVLEYSLENTGGMTKREQFAMAAMVGFINTGCVRDDNNGVVKNQYNYASIAKSAVDQADALIDALNKEV